MQILQNLVTTLKLLEARLADFSEAERGIIEGLPEEALVSNQLDSLLNGIEEGEIPTWARPAVASSRSYVSTTWYVSIHSRKRCLAQCYYTISNAYGSSLMHKRYKQVLDNKNNRSIKKLKLSS